jgi:hypothetical protein
VRDALAESLAKDDVGASVAVVFRGEPVVDLWGGYADAGRTPVATTTASHRPSPRPAG